MTTAPDPPLTPRERDLLQALTSGASYRQIGNNVHLAEATVKAKMRDLFRKLGARNAAQAVHIGWQRGLIGAPSTAASTPAHDGGA